MDRGIVTLQKELHCFFPDWNKVMLLSLYVEISELLREKNDKVIEYLNVLYLKGEWELLNYYIRG